MTRTPRKLTATVTALAVLAAQTFCLCRSAAAVAQAQPAAPAARHCCKHDPPEKSPAKSDGHSHQTDGHCRHCDGFTAPAVKTSHPNVDPSTTFLCVLAAITHGGVAALQPIVVDPGGSRAEFLSPPTLLRLSCALNL